MSTLTTTRTAHLPRVNLLPPEIAADQRFRRLQLGLGAAVLAALGVVGALYASAAASEAQAEDGLAAVQANEAKIKREIAQFREVPAVMAQVAKAETQLKTALGNEVRWSYALNDLTGRIPDGVAITRIEVSQPTAAPAFTTVSGVETGGAVIANIRYSGVAVVDGRNGSRSNVSAWLEALAKQKTYANPYFTLSEYDAKAAETVKFESTVDVNEQALSRRYTSEKGK